MKHASAEIAPISLQQQAHFTASIRVIMKMVSNLEITEKIKKSFDSSLTFSVGNDDMTLGFGSQTCGFVLIRESFVLYLTQFTDFFSLTFYVQPSHLTSEIQVRLFSTAYK